MLDYVKENHVEISKGNVIIFIESEIEKNELYNCIKDLGVICNFERLKPASISKRIKAIATAYEVKIEDSTIDYFIETCGTFMQDLINEIRKLIEYVGPGGIIKKQDIDKLCIKQTETVIFDLTDNLGNKNISAALQILHNLLYNKEPIQKILILIYNHFKKLYFVKIAQKENKNISEALNLKPNQMFLTIKYKKQATYFTEDVLRNILQELANLDANSKLGLIDLNIGLESILCSYI